MADPNTVMSIVLLIGMSTVVICICGLISDRKKQRLEDREARRKHLSENTAKTILSYRAKQESAATYYRRRA